MARPLIISDQLMVGGLQRDAAGDSRYQSFRELNNFDIVYDPVALQRRKGWQYYGPTLPEIPQQAWSCKLRSHPDADTEVALTHYIFVKTLDTSPTPSVSKIYCFVEGTTSPIYTLYDGTNETADWKNNPAPFAVVEYRAFFGVGTGLRWVDTDAITGNTSYGLTMDVPVPLPDIIRANAYDLTDARHSTTQADIVIKPWVEYPVSAPSTDIQSIAVSTATPNEFTLQNASPKVAQQFRISDTKNCFINNVSFMMLREGAEVGSFKVSLREDDSGDPASEAMTSESGLPAESSPLDIRSSIHKDVDNATSISLLVKFNFPITYLKRNTTYWFVIEPDATYLAGSAMDLKLNWHVDNTYAAEYKLKYYLQSSSSWVVLQNGFSHMVIDGPGGNTGVVINNIYHGSSDYKFATRNLFVDEGQLTEARSTDPGQGLFHPSHIETNTLLTPGGTKFAVYRTGNPTGASNDSSTFNLLGVADTGYDIIDCVIEHPDISYLTANSGLRTQITDFDGRSVRPTHIIPYAARLFVVTDDRLLHFSERLENEGALGQVGDSLYFSYPAENKIMFREPIKDFYLYNGVLYIFTENGIDLVRGGDSPLNPPPDLLQDSVSSHQGTSIDGCVTEVRGNLLFITSEKIIKAFQGNVPIQSLSSAIQSILNSSTFNPEKAAMIGYDYYLGASTDGLGSFSDIYIFSFDERRMFWKQYSYGIAFKHLHGTVNEKLLAAPATGTKRLIQLETGSLDDDANITSTVETHSVPSPNRSRWTKFELECSYPTATPPSMTVTATAKDGATSAKAIQPTNSNDVRQHSGGLRILSEECRLKIETAGNQADEIRMITLK